jgi:SAM-dependent methyltransferase
MMSRRAALASTAGLLMFGQERRPQMFSNAEAYERFMGRWSRLLAPRLADFGAVPETGSVLDIGSGTGAMAFAVAERRPSARVTGIDPSPEYVAYAEAKNRFGDRVAFHKGDAQRLDFANQSFDACVSLLVFNFIPDAAAALREARRVTKPRGIISAAVWEYGDGMRMLRAFWDAAAEVDAATEKLDEKRMRLCRRGELGRLWTEGGLENVHEEALGIDMRFTSFADYWEPFLLGQGPAGTYVHTLDENRLRRLRAAVKRRLGVTSEDRAFVLPARVWAVRGAVS